MTTFSRRGFLRAATAGGIAASGVLGLPKAFADSRRSLAAGTSALVIGSGFGGSVAAQRLGAAGVRTLVLERGQHYAYSPTKQVFGNELDPISQTFWFQSTAEWPGVQPVPITPVPGLIEVITAGAIQIAAGACLGGGSVVYAGVTVQPPRTYFDALYPKDLSYDELDQVYYPRVRANIGASTMPSDIYNSDPFTHSRAFDSQVSAAGYAGTPVDTVFNWTKVRGELAGRLRPSAIAGESSFGNSDGAKNDLTQTYLPRALATGNVSIATLTEVTGIHQGSGGRGWSVDVRRYNSDGTVAGTATYSADLLFVAAGSVNTTRLMVAARDSGALPDLSAAVGTNWGSNGDTFAFRTFDGPIGATQGAPCASTVFVDSDKGLGIPTRIENWYFMPFNGTNYMAQFSVSADLDNRGTWTYDATTGKVDMLDWDESKNTPSLEAASNFNQLIIDKGLGGPVDSIAPSADGTAHPLGGMPIGQATDLYGRVNGYRGLYVLDGSLLPGNVGGANPSLTIAALAERAMDDIVATGC